MRKESGYSVLIVSSSDKFNESLSSVMPKEDYDPIITANSVNEARRLINQREFDLVLVNSPLTDESGVSFSADVAESSSSGVLLLVKGEYFDAVTDKVQDYGVLTVAKPVTKQIMYQSLKMLCSTRERLFRFDIKQQTFEEKLAEIKLVNRAKLLLMEKTSVGEEQAHRFIEKTAMNTRKHRREIAEEIIKKYAG